MRLIQCNLIACTSSNHSMRQNHIVWQELPFWHFFLDFYPNKSIFQEKWIFLWFGVVRCVAALKCIDRAYFGISTGQMPMHCKLSKRVQCQTRGSYVESNASTPKLTDFVPQESVDRSMWICSNQRTQQFYFCAEYLLSDFSYKQAAECSEPKKLHPLMGQWIERKKTWLPMVNSISRVYIRCNTSYIFQNPIFSLQQTMNIYFSAAIQRHIPVHFYRIPYYFAPDALKALKVVYEIYWINCYSHIIGDVCSRK